MPPMRPDSSHRTVKPWTCPTLSWSSMGMTSATICGPGLSGSRGGGMYCGSFGMGGGSSYECCAIGVSSCLLRDSLIRWHPTGLGLRHTDLLAEQHAPASEAQSERVMLQGSLDGLHGRGT